MSQAVCIDELIYLQGYFYISVGWKEITYLFNGVSLSIVTESVTCIGENLRKSGLGALPLKEMVPLGVPHIFLKPRAKMPITEKIKILPPS